jgi:hypothetical protein
MYEAVVDRALQGMNAREDDDRRRGGVPAAGAGSRSPMEPDPQTGRDADREAQRDVDAPTQRTDERASGGRPPGGEDDSPVERYGDSPGMGVIDPSHGVPEPNEPA